MQPGFGGSIVTVLAHLGGRSVAIVANDPGVLAGTIDSDAADKAAHFLDVADAFGLPCIFLADNPGVLAGTVAEGQGILRHAARLFLSLIHISVRVGPTRSSYSLMRSRSSVASNSRHCLRRESTSSRVSRRRPRWS